MDRPPDEWRVEGYPPYSEIYLHGFLALAVIVVVLAGFIALLVKIILG